MNNLVPVFLWTDCLVFLLIATTICYARVVMRTEYLRSSWHKAYIRPTRMIAAVILLAYALIGTLDCIHYRAKDSNHVKSVLDWVLLPNSEQMETTYSAPFATESFSQQMVETSDGAISWVKTKLTYVTGAAILPKILIGLLYGILAWALITLLIKVVWIKLCKQSFAADLPWRTAWLTLGTIIIIAAIAKQLMQDYHIFGTDKVGIDVFYSSIKSIRTGLIIGSITTLITLPFAVLFGCLAGYLRGWVDDLIQYIYTTLSSVPGVLLISAAVLILDTLIERHADMFNLMAQRTDMRLLMLCCILGITSWTSLCRILRGEVLKLRDQEFVLAARALGLNTWQIIIKHIVPNLTHIILIAVVLDFSGLVLAEAVLSYVGVGVDPTTYSWGNMINAARLELGREPIVWWSLAGSFVLMFILVLSANIFSDGVRDAFDPKAV